MHIKKGLYFDPEIGEFIPEQVREEIIPDPEVLFFKTDKETLTDEASALLSWDVRFAVNVTVNKIPVAISGTMPFHTQKPTTVVLVARNKLNKTIEQHLYIDINQTPPIIQFFKADRSFIIKNYPVTLSWKVLNAASVSINNGVGEVKQRTSTVVKPTEDSVYTLKASNYFGYSSEIDLALTVFPLPLVNGIDIPLKQFSKEIIVLQEPLFYEKPPVHNHIEITLPFFSNLIDFTRMDTLASKIILKKKAVNSMLFPRTIFSKLIKKQKKIAHIIQILWKKKIKKELKNIIQ
jgi:hypothetical protein